MSTLEEQLIERDAILDDLKAHLIRAQQKMKQYEDGKRRELSFEVRDMVYLKLQPYRQKSLSKKRNKKLSARFYGPFEVLEKVEPVAYKLRLPQEARIHLVFHVSQLKPSMGHQSVNPTIPPQITADLVPETEPKEVLNVRFPHASTGHPGPHQMETPTQL